MAGLVNVEQLSLPRPLNVLGLSGGKDSTALAIEMRRRGEPIDEFWITPTGNETPEMLAHWARLEALLDMTLTVVPNHSLVELSERQNMLPNTRMRWCTRMVKIVPVLARAKRLAAEGVRVVMHSGLRADEETRAGIFGDEVATRHPLREWGMGLGDVLDVLRREGVEIPARTDCALCPFQRLSEWFALWRDHPDLWREGEALEAKVSAARGRPLTILAEVDAIEIDKDLADAVVYLDEYPSEIVQAWSRPPTLSGSPALPTQELWDVHCAGALFNFLGPDTSRRECGCLTQAKFGNEGPTEGVRKAIRLDPALPSSPEGITVANLERFARWQTWLRRELGPLSQRWERARSG